MRITNVIVVLFIFVAFPLMAQRDTTGHTESAETFEVPDSLHAVVEGTIIEIESHIERDGGLWIRLDIGEEDLFVLYFGSLRTIPPPSEERLELYRAIRKLVGGRSCESHRLCVARWVLADGHRTCERGGGSLTNPTFCVIIPATSTG